jgi:uncharacterized protein
MIDMHVHVSDPALPGSKPFPAYLERPEAAARALHREMAAVGVTSALAMGSLHITEADPLGIGGVLAVMAAVAAVLPIGVADPRRSDDAAHLGRVRQELARGHVRAIKCYLGYLHVGPEDARYAPYYRLAAEHGLPVVFHTGDTYASAAKVKYAHPLRVDEVAVDHPDVRFVLAHFGNPWFDTAAEVLYKNDNVWADLSGFFVGDATYQRRVAEDGFLEKVAERVRFAFDYTERPDRFLYGSDWPLAPLPDYVRAVRSIVPERHHGAVFEANARALFGV